MGREPRAVLLLLALAALGHAARLLTGDRAPPGQLLAPSSSGSPDPAQHRTASARAARPLSGAETIEVNRADANEISRLPRVGMSLAKRIVADRTARGPFRGPDDLDRVPGVGQAVLAALDGKVSYAGAGPQLAAGSSDAKLSISTSYGTGPGRPRGPPIDLNSASLADLVTLPEIGPARARAILAYRREAGPFAAVSDLGRVPGFSQRLVARLAGWVTVSGSR